MQRGRATQEQLPSAANAVATSKATGIDRRLVTARYGQMILDSLPPFYRKIEWSNKQRLQK